MKIGVDARPLLTPDSGIGRYLAEVLRRATMLGHEWYLYSHQHIDLPPDMRVSHLRSGNVASGGLSTPFAQTHFGRWANRDRLNVYWSPRHHLVPGLQMPAVVTVHDLVWRKAPESMIRLGWLSERLLMPGALARASRILVPSKSTERDVVEYIPQAAPRLRVVPLGTDLARFKPCLPASAPPEPYMLVVGTVEPRKNHARILEAFKRIRADNYIEHRLVIVGAEGWKTADVLGRLRQTEGVIYAGRVPDEQLAYFYAKADFVVAPSLYEGFGLQVLEAMSFGKPIITSNISSMPEVGGDAAILVDPRSAENIAEAMLALISDRTLHGELAGRGRQLAAGYSWDKTAAFTLQVLEEAAAIDGHSRQ